MTPNTSPDFWFKTRELVSALQRTHRELSPLNSFIRRRACCQCLATISWAVSYFDRVRLPRDGCDRPFLTEMVKSLTKVVRVLALLIRPLDTKLISHLEDFHVVTRLLSIPAVQSDEMQAACVEAMRNFIDDRPEVVNAVLRQASRQLKSGATHQERVIAKRSSPPAQLSSSPPRSPLLQFLTAAREGEQIPSSVLNTAQLILPGQGLSSVAELHDVVTSDLLPVLNTLLNAHWRGHSHGFLVLGADPDSRRLRGILMNFDDQDSFRIGFDKHVQERLHPQPTAGMLRIHFLALSGGECAEPPPHVLSGADSRRQQRERYPCVVVVEVTRILIEDAFSYSDIDKITKRRRYVTITMQPEMMKMVTSIQSKRSIVEDNLTTNHELKHKITELDKMIAASRL